MGHSCKTGCISSIGPFYTDIVKMFLWIKLIVRQRAEADNLPLTPCTNRKITGDTHLPKISPPA